MRVLKGGSWFHVHVHPITREGKQRHVFPPVKESSETKMSCCSIGVSSARTFGAY